MESCSRYDQGQPDAAADFLKRLPTSDVVVWTNGSVPSPLGAGGAGVQAHAEDDYPPLFFLLS